MSISPFSLVTKQQMKTTIKNPYKRRRVNGKQSYDHRLIMEEHLERKLKSSEVVHHIDGDKLNNDIKNLKIMSIDEHTLKHKDKNTSYKIIKCGFCGCEFKMREKLYNFKMKNQERFYCSYKCIGNGVAMKTTNNKSKNYQKNVEKGIRNGWTGYRISKEFSMNITTVYNYIHRIINNKHQSYNGYYTRLSTE